MLSSLMIPSNSVKRQFYVNLGETSMNALTSIPNCTSKIKYQSSAVVLEREIVTL